MFGQCLLSGAFGGASDGTDYFDTKLYSTATSPIQLLD